MKLTNLVCLAAVAVAAVSCAEKNEGIIDNNAPKTITISLANPVSRALEDRVNASAATLKSAYVLFADNSGNFITLDESVQTYFSDVTALTSVEGVTFHELSKDVTKVIIVGNVGKKGVDAVKGNNLATLEAITTLESLGDVDVKNNDLLLYGKCEQLVPAELQGEHVNYLTAKVTLYPNISRVEIHSVGCTDLGTKFQSLDIQQFAVANFNSSCTVGGTVRGLIPSVGANDMSSYFGKEAGADKPEYSFDVIADVKLTSETKTSDFGGKAYAYNFYASDNVQIMVNVNTDKGQRYLSTQKFEKGGQEYTDGFAAGSIYTMDFLFTEKDLDEFNTQCIQVIANVSPWTIVPLNPSFE